MEFNKKSSEMLQELITILRKQKRFKTLTDEEIKIFAMGVLIKIIGDVYESFRLYKLV
jgi:hypothetical protein